VTLKFPLLQLEKLIGKNYFLNLSAKEAYKAYVRAYDSHHLKQIFDVATLDLAKVAASFGFRVPPAVDLRILYMLSEFESCAWKGVFTVSLYVTLLSQSKSFLFSPTDALYRV
jgi:hypothetical protein